MGSTALGNKEGKGHACHLSCYNMQGKDLFTISQLRLVNSSKLCHTPVNKQGSCRWPGWIFWA